MGLFKDGDRVRHKKDGDTGTVNTFHPGQGISAANGYYIIDWDDLTTTGEYEHDLEAENLSVLTYFPSASSFGNIDLPMSHSDTYREGFVALPTCDCGSGGAPNTQNHSRWCVVYKKEF